MRKIVHRTSCLGAAFVAAMAGQALASGIDTSANYASWTDGSNGGTGFGAWAFHSDSHGSGFAGLEKGNDSDNVLAVDGSAWKLYAVDFNAAAAGDEPWEEATAFRAFDTPLSLTGDTFSLSFEHGGVAEPGQVGYALRNGNVTGSGARDNGARLQVYFEGGDGNLTVVDADGAREIDGVGFTFFGYDTQVTLTSPDTYSLTITRYNGAGTADAPVVVTGTLAGSGTIDSFAVFNWNFSAATDAANHDAYFNNLAYSIVPEPASVSLLALGGLMMMRRSTR